MYGKVNDKVDAYAFGVVILELLSGRKPISCDFPKGQESLVMWVCSAFVFIHNVLFLLVMKIRSSLNKYCPGDADA